MTDFYSRHLVAHIREALSDTPVVLINGPRQCGKSTMARHYLPDMPYFSLDDDAVLGAVRTDPGGFVRRLEQGTQQGTQHSSQQ